MATYVFEYRFVKWEDFNPPLKNKKAEPTWCRLDHAIFEHPALSGQSTHKQNLFIVMLTRAIARSGYGQLTGTTIHLMCKLKQHDVKTYASHLQTLGIIEYDFRELSKKVSVGRLTDKTDKTDKTDRHISSEVETSLALVETKPKKPKPQKAPDEFKPAYQVWLAYVQAHVARYGTEPDKNAKVMNQCRMLVERVGLENAKELVGFYLQHNDSWYVKKVHVIECCLKDAEGLMTQLRANFKVTNTFAQQQDRSQSNLQVFEELAAKLSREGTSG